MNGERRGPPDPEPNPQHDIVAGTFPDLARQLGVRILIWHGCHAALRKAEERFFTLCGGGKRKAAPRKRPRRGWRQLTLSASR